jgi:polyhydroxyalkanoate synthesis regulator phasin
MNPIQGMSVDGIVNKGMSSLDKMQSDLETKMQSMMEGGKEIKNEELIIMQYEMGKYQTYVTTLNNTVQSIQNQTKELAKSIH